VEVSKWGCAVEVSKWGCAVEVSKWGCAVEVSKWGCEYLNVQYSSNNKKMGMCHGV